MKRRCRLAVSCILAGGLIASGANPAQAASPEPKKVAAVEGITEYQLNNGLRVLLFPDPSQSKVTVNMTALVGSRQEGYGETGMAHLLEHMLFKGTPTHPFIPKELQEHGATFNGSTTSDRVNYYETLADSGTNLEFAIALEADRLVNSSIKKEDLDSEMTVVRNEFERGENSPQGVLMERIQEVAYDWHNYGKPTIGNRTDIERVPVENLRAFYRKYYQPDNIVLVVAGKFEEGRGLELVRKYFGPIPRPARKLDATWTEEPPQDGERLVTLRRVGELGVVGVAYHIPAAPHEDSAALEVLANILTSQPSGRLYKALVETKKASGVSASARAEHDPGLMTMTAPVTRESSVEEVRDILLATVEGIGANGVTSEEVSRARQQILKARERTAMDTTRIGVSLSTWIAQGDWRLYFLNRDRVEKVTPEAVQAAAAHYLQRNNRTVGLFIPTDKAERVAIPETPDLAALVADYKGRPPIAEGEAFEATPANVEARVQRQEMAGGIKVTLLPKKTRGAEAHVTLQIHFGNDDNLKGLEAAGEFLPRLMVRETKQLDQQHLRDKLDELGATLNGGGSQGEVSFSIQAKHDTLPAALEILRQVLREPALPADQFEVLKRQQLASLQRSRTEPDALAARRLSRELHPYSKDNTRYVPTIDEEIERVRNASIAQVTELYRDYLGSQAGELTLVGDFDSNACLPILQPALAGWTAAKPYARIAMPLAAEVPGAQHTINTPDKANATYTAGLEFAMNDDDADYPALVMGDYILGAGTLSSRLGVRIRQKDGLSYGVTSRFSASALDQRASFGITAICNPKNIDRLRQDVQEELDRLLRDGVTQQELDNARQGYLQARKVARSTDTALAGQLTTLRYEGRTMARQAQLEKKIEALTPEQIVTALRKHIDPKKLVIVTAGDFETKTSPNGN